MSASLQSVVRLGILISGRGSNMAALYEAIQAKRLTGVEITVVISNHSNAQGLEWAKEKGLNSVAIDKASAKNRRLRDESILTILKEYAVDLILLAGYDRIISSTLLEAFPGKILNIHPSLLPLYGGPGMIGKAVHEAVIAAGETESGCTVHLVTDVVDGGTILGQQRVPVLPNDTAESLAERVLNAEHQLYANAVQNYLSHITVS
jgi:phosphoribosylglycinamide formyltransferase 1